ncbi:MAG: iron ABC transporter permease [Oscillospiraceae bacterium]|jgi:iron complex transport system permease protein|nr:iron ABC transporter permease [Oscillospiraceae bacterium]
MKTGAKIALTAALCLLVLVMAMCIGSVSIPPGDIAGILANKLFGLPLKERISNINAEILWKIRLPRALMAFIVGGALAASGTVMQSVLRNPLASSYTLGVSSGASLGAGLVMLTGASFSFVGMFTLPLVGFVFGLGTVFLAMGMTARLDRNMENQTIILMGMVLSLFVNAILTLVTALSREHLQQLVFWQMGSFSSKYWIHVAVVAPLLVVCLILLMRYTREMDIMTFGEEQALSAGVELKNIKFLLIAICALMTGTAVAFVGTIGFVDLIAPHVVRRVFGVKHVVVLPVSALFGGAFMALADLVSRTVLAPQELPVGAVTALIGAPFFAYVYFKRRKKAV